MRRLLNIIFFNLLLLSHWFAANAASPVSPSMVGVALNNLDQELDQRNRYIAIRESRIDSIHSLLDSAHSRPDSVQHDFFPLLMALGDAYKGYVADSAKVVYTLGEVLAHNAGKDDWEIRFRLKKLVNMSLTGFGHEAAAEYESITIDSLPDSIKAEAFEAGRQLYSYQAAFYRNSPEAYRAWADKSTERLRRLLEVMPKTAPEYRLREGELFQVTDNPTEALVILNELLEDIPSDSEIAAVALNIISRVYDSRGDTNGRLYYLARSAAADIRNATRETVSLHELGAALYENEDIDRAYRYLNIALSDAVNCNASMRMIQASGALPVITEAHRAAISKSRRWLYAVLGLMTLFSIGLVVMFLRLRLEMRHISEMKETIAEANRQKETYIGHFLNLCTTYMEKLNQFCKITERKISTGHSDELLKLVTTGRFAEEQNREFYSTFDRTFLHIYPTFVDDVNKLLRPEEQLTLNDDELLNTDLRILAFMRLGVEESTRIAQVLNYSVHTIYAYRNRLRNRAINRETFETDVMSIGRY